MRQREREKWNYRTTSLSLWEMKDSRKTRDKWRNNSILCFFIVFILIGFLSLFSLSSSAEISLSPLFGMRLRGDIETNFEQEESHLTATLTLFLSKIEPIYLECLGDELQQLEHRRDSCRTGKLPVKVIQLLLSSRIATNNTFRTIQIGCLDGKKNDPFYQAIIRPYNELMTSFQYDLGGWRGILIEPVFMDSLLKNYQHFKNRIESLDLNKLHFVTSAIAPSSDISTDGTCTFYIVKKNDASCNLTMPWLEQISGTNKKLLQDQLKNDFESCVEEVRVDCQSLGEVIRHAGWDIQFIRKHQKWCSPLKSFENRLDLLLIDVEGSDGSMVRHTLETLCSDYWPRVIIYEDKVIRNRGFSHLPTEYADEVILFLEARGYYVLLVGEDVIAIRMGYNIYDLKHTSDHIIKYVQQSKIARNITSSWLHPRSSRLDFGVQ